jgi:hypothetical protein
LGTEEPYWLEEAYKSPITDDDVGILRRNLVIRDLLSKFINDNFDKSAEILDFAGGYGILTRLMRDEGYNFYHTDKYCPNLFAKEFDILQQSQKRQNKKFDLITAIEVVEHLPNIYTVFDELFKLGDNIIFTTKLQPSNNIEDLENWYYLIPNTGQHISFHTQESLNVIAKHYKAKIYSKGGFLHFITKNKQKNWVVDDFTEFLLKL